MQHNTIEPSRQDEVAAYRERLRDVVEKAILGAIDPRSLRWEAETDAAIDAVLKFMSENDLPLSAVDAAYIPGAINDAARKLVRHEFFSIIRTLSAEGGAKS